MEEDEKEAPEEDEEAVSEDNEDLESEQPEEESEEDSEESNDDNSADSGDDREMHKATCAECGEECDVPFKPEEGRDVFCSDCFRKRRKPRRSFGGGNRGGFGGGNRGGGGFRREQREMHDATCAECKKKCQVPFKPSGDKPVLCKDCYMKAR